MGEHSILNDMVFKIVFGSEKNEAILRALLNALLGFTGEQRIAEVTILNPWLEKDYSQDKGPVVDIRARDGQGRLFNIEVHVASEVAYAERALYYATRLFAGQLQKGQDYEELNQTICISILGFSMFRDVEALHSIYRVYDEQNQRRLTDILQLHFIELSKFKIEKPHALRSPFEKWLHVLKFSSVYESGVVPLPESLREEEGIEMAIDSMKDAWSDPAIQIAIEEHWKAQMDATHRLKTAWRNGMAEGKAEALLEAAQKLLAEGMDRGAVCRILGLREDDLP